MSSIRSRLCRDVTQGHHYAFLEVTEEYFNKVAYCVYAAFALGCMSVGLYDCMAVWLYGCIVGGDLEIFVDKI